MDSSDSKRLLVIGAIVGAGAFLCAAGAGAWFMVTNGAAGVGGDLTAVVDDQVEQPDEPEGPYEPSSVWIEEGLDPDVTTFGFGGKEGKPAAEPAGPELSEYQLQNLVYKKQNSLMQCYADALADNPDLQGKVDMEFGVAPDGHVAMVKVIGSTLRSKSTEDCLVEKSRGWSFPATNRSTLMKFDTDFTFVYE